MANTSIEWADKVWNCIRGCSIVSEGCRNCYAMRQAHRFNTEGGPYQGLTVLTSTGPKWNGDIMLVPSKLGEPLCWKKPARIFVNSMSDVFHEGVDDSFIDRIFGVIQMCPQHIFQILTKRPKRMMEYMNAPGRGSTVMQAAAREAFDEQTRADRSGHFPKTAEYIPIKEQEQAFTLGRSIITVKGGTWPPPNAWMGTSVENQKTADERVPWLLRTAASVRWISAEPLLGEIDLRQAHITVDRLPNWPRPTRVDWVVVGGESGPGARPMEPAWARSIRDQCKARGIAFHFKQWGEYLPAKQDSVSKRGGTLCNITDKPAKIGKKLAGRLLDGREWNEFPA